MTKKIESVCVYCGSSTKVDPMYLEQAKNVGTFLAEQNITVVYGGGNVGMMKALADGVLEKNGCIIGVIPHHLHKLELAHPHLTKLYTTQSMHERKAMMLHLADACIALPGGYGTIEELMEAVTWTQLNYQDKPVGILNIHNYFGGIIDWIEHAVQEKFIHDVHRNIISCDNTIAALLTKMSNTRYVEIRKHI